MKKILTLALMSAVLILASCKNSQDEAASTDNSEAAQQIGDIMASIDEAGGSSGSFGFVNTFARLAPEDVLESVALESGNSDPKDLKATSIAPRAACGTTGFSSCSNNVITRTFNGCSIGAATLSGTVSLTFHDASVDNTCAMAVNSDSIIRVPNFTVTGLRGATLTVSKTASEGQKISKTGPATYNFTNDGIKRKFVYNNNTLFDFTTLTTSSLGITGNSRNGRVLNGGTLRVINNESGRYCDYSPSNVTWNSNCNCAVSGSWTATCSDSTTSSLTINSCGSATFSMDSTSTTVNFDRCY